MGQSLRARSARLDSGFAGQIRRKTKTSLWPARRWAASRGHAWRFGNCDADQLQRRQPQRRARKADTTDISRIIKRFVEG